MRTWTIELRTDHSDKQRDKAIEDAIKVAAKHVFTQAVVISDKRKPQIKVHSSDFIYGEDEISLAGDIPEGVTNAYAELMEKLSKLEDEEAEK